MSVAPSPGPGRGQAHGTHAAPAPLRVLILSIYHDPEPIPKTGELARELRRRGHDVTVVTAFPHYPSGKLYPGYSVAPWRWEDRDGLRVLRTYIYPYHGSRSSLRMLNYLTWMISSIQAAWLAPPCDVIYVWHPPLTVGVSAWVISKLKRVPFVYDVQDLWPESALASGLMRPGRVVNALYRLSDWVYRRAPRILVVSQAAAAYLRERGVRPEKISVAHHWVDTTPFELESARDIRSEFGWGRKFIVMFAGNLGMVQGLETVVEAAALLRDGPLGEQVEFVLVGDGANRPRLERLVAEKSLSNVRFAGQHPASDMPAFMRAADVLLVHLRPSEIADHAIPTKILSYMAAGRPVLCATGGAAAGVIRAAEAGIVIEPGNPAALAGAVTQLFACTPAERARLGQNGRTYLHAHFDKRAVIDEYERVLVELAGGRPPVPREAEERA
jgi:colanic acid biosynthesis glycosyl transferase WcaI